MTIFRAASFDADLHSICANKSDQVRWLQPRSEATRRSRRNAGLRHCLPRIAGRLSVAALLSLAAADADITPSAARAAGLEDASGAAASIVVDAPPDPGPVVIAGADVAPMAAAAPEIPAPELVAEAPIDVPDVAATLSAPAGQTPDEGPSAGEGWSAADLAAIDRATRDPYALLQFDGMRVPRWIAETILRAADMTSVDPVYMMALADKESSFLPATKASTSSAEGLFQFIGSTWLEVVRSFGPQYGLDAEAAAIQASNGQLSVADETMRERILGLRRNPFLSALMAAEMMKRDRLDIERRLGRSISRSEFYLVHFLGVDRASKFIVLRDNKPTQSAPRVFPAAAKANKALFFAKHGRKMRHLSLAEVYDKIDEMIDKRLDRYVDVETIVTADASL
jgi:hypothetical protein